MSADPHAAPRPWIRAELQLVAGAITAVLFLLFGKDWLGGSFAGTAGAFFFAWLFVVMLWSSFAVVRHAESLATLLGEPYGTLILTLAVISIEVIMIAAVMLTGGEKPGLARDTMFSVLMIVMNGMMGLAVLLGAARHHEPTYNLQGANAYLGVLVPLAVLTLVLPSFTPSSPGGTPSTTLAIYLAVISIGLYAVFLGIQTMRHRTFFVQPALRTADGEPLIEEDEHHHVPRSIAYHAVFLIATMVPIVLLSKSMGVIVDYGIGVLGAPQALGGFLVAVLVLSPEGMAAMQAALANRLQRSVNICMGSALATIGLTVPAVLVISFVTGMPVELGLGPVEMVLLLLTLGTSIVNAAGGKTNVLEGLVHLLLFFSYIVLIFD